MIIKEVNTDIVSVLKRWIAEFFLDHNKEPGQIILGSDVYQSLKDYAWFYDEIEYELNDWKWDKMINLKFDDIPCLEELFMEDTLIQFIW